MTTALVISCLLMGWVLGNLTPNPGIHRMRRIHNGKMYAMPPIFTTLRMQQVRAIRSGKQQEKQQGGEDKRLLQRM